MDALYTNLIKTATGRGMEKGREGLWPAVRQVRVNNIIDIQSVVLKVSDTLGCDSIAHSEHESIKKSYYNFSVLRSKLRIFVNMRMLIVCSK